jgi:hypothetical protein
MTHQEFLQPVVALAAWTMVMWVWMYATRIPAMGAAKSRGLTRWCSKGLSRSASCCPRTVQWKAQNYNHLHEAPTVFYAVAHCAGPAGGRATASTPRWRGSMWACASCTAIVQATVNKVMLRFLIFIAVQPCR